MLLEQIHSSLEQYLVWIAHIQKYLLTVTGSTKRDVSPVSILVYGQQSLGSFIPGSSALPAGIAAPDSATIGAEIVQQPEAITRAVSKSTVAVAYTESAGTGAGTATATVTTASTLVISTADENG